jgi:glycine oxidase
VWADRLDAAGWAALHPGVPDGLDRRPDVLVVGGGLVGLATAVACRRAGLGRVVVLERAERLAPAASGGNGGAIAPDMHVLTDSADFVAFGRGSLAWYRQLDGEWDGALGLRTTQWLNLLPAAEAPSGQFEVLDRAAIRALEPDLVPPEDCAGLLVTGQAAVNPLRLAGALAARAGQVATGIEVTGTELAGDRIVTVRTSHGEFRPGALVMATGLVPPPWSAGVPQRWVKGHMLAFAAGPWRLGSVLAGPFGGGSPQPDGGVVCGGTFDLDDATPDPRPAVIEELAGEFSRLVPAARGVPLSHRWCCFRPVVDGRQPVLDRLPGTVNGWLSAGHFTTGLMLAGGSGQALAGWIRDGTRPPGLATFTLPG